MKSGKYFFYHFYANKITGAAVGGALALAASRGGNRRRGGRRRYKSSRRGRRHATTEIAAPVLIEGPDEEIIGADLEPVFRSIEDIDDFDCAKFYVCELSTRSQDDLSEDEKRVLSVFQDDSQGIQLTSAKSPYDLAARLGRLGGNKSFCAYRYSRCEAAEGGKDIFGKNLV